MTLVERTMDALKSLSANPLAVLGATLLVVLLVHVVPYVLDPHGFKSIPGPFVAKFSNIWIGWITAQGHRSEVVHALHLKYGPAVRLAPNHISIASPDGLSAIYAHGNGSLKSEFYDAFVSATLGRGLFNTRNRPEHARKRKIVSAVFSMKNVLGFEGNVRVYVGGLMEQWDRLFALVRAGEKEGKEVKGDEGEGGWRGKGGRLWLDCLPWWNYLAFDIIGDLAFGQPFGMLKACKDRAPVATSHSSAMASYGKGSESASTKEIPAVKILNDRGEYSASLGVLPTWWRPYAQRLPWFAQGKEAVHNLSGLAVAAVARRLKADPHGEEVHKADLLAKLQEGKDENGEPMGRRELTAEALTQLIAGSDTTSNTSCAITYYLAKNPTTQRTLQSELDAVLGPPLGSDLPSESVAQYDQVKSIAYLEAVINESLRMHSTSGIGLPRIAPEGGIVFSTQATYNHSGGANDDEQTREWYFPAGAVLSVPTYSLHRDMRAWGEDVESFRPERWLEKDSEGKWVLKGEKEAREMWKSFNPFSYGPRACVGRNLAMLELQIIIASIMRRYDFVLQDPDEKFETREGFLRKPVKCDVGIKRRGA